MGLDCKIFLLSPLTLSISPSLLLWLPFALSSSSLPLFLLHSLLLPSFFLLPSPSLTIPLSPSRWPLISPFFPSPLRHTLSLSLSLSLSFIFSFSSSSSLSLSLFYLSVFSISLFSSFLNPLHIFLSITFFFHFPLYHYSSPFLSPYFSSFLLWRLFSLLFSSLPLSLIPFPSLSPLFRHQEEIRGHLRASWGSPSLKILFFFLPFFPSFPPSLYFFLPSSSSSFLSIAFVFLHNLITCIFFCTFVVAYVQFFSFIFSYIFFVNYFILQLYFFFPLNPIFETHAASCFLTLFMTIFSFIISFSHSLPSTIPLAPPPSLPPLLPLLLP